MTGTIRAGGLAVAAGLALLLGGCASDPAPKLPDASQETGEPGTTSDSTILTVNPSQSYEGSRAQGNSGPDVAWYGQLKVVEDCLAVDREGDLMLAVFFEGVTVVSRDGDEVEVRLGEYETVRTGVDYRGRTVPYETREALEAFTNGTECADRLGVDVGTLIATAEPVS